MSYSIIQYWKGLGYKHAAMIYINDGYGEAYKESLVKHGAVEGIAVKAYPYNEGDTAGIKKSLDNMLESKVNVVMAVAFGKGFAEIAEYAEKIGMMGKGKMWMFGDATGTGDFDALAPAAKQAAHGSMRVLAAGAVDGNVAWTAMIAKLKATMTRDAFNPHYPDYWKVTAEDEAAFASTLVPGNGLIRDIGAYEFDGVVAAGILACLVSHKGPVPDDFGAQVYAKRQAADFHATTGHVKFDKVGNREINTANYMLSNLIVSKTDPAAPATLNLMGKYNAAADNGKGLWEFDANKKFQYPGGATEPPTDITVPTHDKMFAGSSMKVLSYILAILSVGLGSVFMCWTIYQRNTKVVRHSQPEFLVAVCIGCMISSLSIIPVNMDDQGANNNVIGFTSKDLAIVTPANVDFDKHVYPYVQFDNATTSAKSTLDISCMLSLWMYSLGFVLTFGALFAKIWRVNKIFLNKKLSKIVIKSRDLVLPIFAVLLVDASILLAWTLYNPLKWYRFVLTEDQYHNPLTSIGKCDTAMRHTDTSSGWLFLTPLALVHVVVLLVGNVLSYRARNIATSFQEGKYIAMAMVSNLQVLGLAIPILLIVADNAAASGFVRSAVIFLNDVGVLSFVFIPKMTSHHFGWNKQAQAQTAGTNDGADKEKSGYPVKPRNGSVIVQAGAVVAGAVPKVPIKASSGLQVTHVAPLNVAEHVA